MHDGKVYDDKFYELFSKKVPVKHIIKLAVSWNAEKQMDHFRQLNHHIQENDDFAEYAKEIVDTTRAVLQQTLKEVGYQKEITLEQYLEATYLIQNEKKSEVDPDILGAIQLLDEVTDDRFETLLNEGSAEELDWELKNLHPYDFIPLKNPVSVLVKQETEQKPVPESQKPNESVPELEQPIETTPESQEPQESVSESQEREESIPTEQKPEESTPEPQAPTETVAEDNESVEEILAEPSQSDNAVPETPELKEAVSQPQTSEEEVSNPQESKQES